MTIGDKIYELRSNRNLSLREFAEIAGVTHTAIARLESDTFGTQKVYLETIFHICKNLNYSFADFLSETGYLPNIPNTFAAPPSEELTEKEKALLQAFKNLLPETQDFVLRTAQSLSDRNKSKTLK